ncbi:hypothetical protein EMCRGX_G019943 [Ephydatia muelleri]
MGWPCFKSKTYVHITQEPKTVHIVFGFFFIINYIVGTGFLGIPYSFYEAGMLAGIVTLIVISFIAWNTASWELEVMARAQALETFREEQKHDSKYLAGDKLDPQPSLLTPHTEHPRYEILLTRKFEMTELCHVFFNRWVKYLYLVIMSIYSFLAGWSYSTVAGSAWSTNLPFSTTTFNQCSDSQFHLSVAPPEEGCLASYRLCVLFFAVIVVPLSCLDLKEQGFVQMILGLLRFSIIISMVLYCVANLIRGDPSPHGRSNTTGTVLLFEQSSEDGFAQQGSCNSSDSEFVTSFHIRGWLIAIPVFTYAQILHQGVPALTHPIRQKKLLRWFMMVVFATTSLCYMVLGIVVSLWFKSDVQETATLNWGTFIHHPSIPLRTLSYLIILFPSLDVCSAYPLVVYTIVNNLYTVFMGRDTTQKVYSYEHIIILVMKVVFAVLPIVASLFVTNLVYVLTYAGLMGFFICFFFPTSLQLASQWKCSKVFGALCKAYNPEHRSNNQDGTKAEEEEPFLSDGKIQKLPCNSPSHNPIYLTPYSSRVLSHPIAVCTMGGFGFCLFAFAVASLQYPPGSSKSC